MKKYDLLHLRRSRVEKLDGLFGQHDALEWLGHRARDLVKAIDRRGRHPAFHFDVGLAVTSTHDDVTRVNRRRIPLGHP